MIYISFIFLIIVLMLIYAMERKVPTSCKLIGEERCFYNV